MIIDLLAKMTYYEPIKITIDIPEFAEIIPDLVVKYHDLNNSTLSN